MFVSFHLIILLLIQGSNGFLFKQNSISSRAKSRIFIHADFESYERGWSKKMDWVLEDSLPRYTIRAMNEETSSLVSFVLWRSLIASTPELGGYPINFLQSHICRENTTIPSILVDTVPFLDDYTFSGDGIEGSVYGLKFVADGSRMTTPPLINVKESLPRGYIQTSAEFFELGQPKNSSKVNVHELALSNPVNDERGGLLLKLGATTGVFLAGATAINMLSHHMTVNVFWV